MQLVKNKLSRFRYFPSEKISG